MDCSTYQSATIAHDLNEPVPDEYKNAFSCVFDSGTVEHIFNFPQAIKNCMEMVSIGGHFLTVTTANNFMGHGFYQFSPELYYRVLSPENGFEVESMVLCETDANAAWYRVDDPQNLGSRVELINSRPTYLMVRARKTQSALIFATTPQQSDYSAIWSNRERAAEADGNGRRLIQRVIPEIIKRQMRPFWGHKTPRAFHRL